MEFLALVTIIFSIIFLFLSLIYFIEKSSFKRIRPLKSQIINSKESSDVKLLFHQEMRLNDVYKYRLKNLNKELYDSKLIDYAYRYVNKTLHQELRDLISCAGEYSARLNTKMLEDHAVKAEETRSRLFSDILNSRSR